MSESLNGKVALVTGASGGIGAEIALALANEGAFVGVHYNQGVDRANRLIEIIRSNGGDAKAIRFDISDPKEASSGVKEFAKAKNGLHILVNNAGITYESLLLTSTDQGLAKLLAVNVVGLFACCRAAVRPMVKARYGRIINIGSVVGSRGNSGQAAYAASKSALVGLTKSVARELGGRGITVNLVTPGLIDTPMTGNIDKKFFDSIIPRIPVGRPGIPADVASLIAFLAGPHAGYITGQVIAVDGGLAM